MYILGQSISQEGQHDIVHIYYVSLDAASVRQIQSDLLVPLQHMQDIPSVFYIFGLRISGLKG